MRITGIDATDASLVAPWDPASDSYVEPEACERCKGECVVPCSECFGQGSYDVDGEQMTCDNRGCEGGLCECPVCDGRG